MEPVIAGSDVSGGEAGLVLDSEKEPREESNLLRVAPSREATDAIGFGFQFRIEAHAPVGVKASPRDIATVASASCTGDGTGSRTWFYARSTVLAKRCLSIGPVPPFRFTIAKRGRPEVVSSAS